MTQQKDSNMTEAAPIFTSTHNALTFAFNFAHQQYDAPAMAKLMSSGQIGSGKGLVGVDGAGQAGMILAAVWRLPALERHAIIARYGQQPVECRCCGAERKSDQWQLAVEGLAAWAVPAGISKMRVRRDLIEMFFLRKGTLKDIATKGGEDRRKLGEQYSAITQRLQQAEAKAQASMDDALRTSGMVGEVAAA